MDASAIRGALATFGLKQIELARAAGLSEACISRQLNGGLRLTKRVERAAEDLLVQRGAQVAGRILEWVEGRELGTSRDKQGRSSERCSAAPVPRTTGYHRILKKPKVGFGPNGEHTQ
ncbi:MAG: hypothetical protein FJX74_20980 [Armatimonadetes bacterium]|nr:hypothetical protein [Armatimonadota bacterium]